MDEAIDDITKTNKFCTKDNLYKATINQISQKYFRMRYYEEQRFKNILNKLVSQKFAVYGAGFLPDKQHICWRKETCFQNIL